MQIKSSPETPADTRDVESNASAGQGVVLVADKPSVEVPPLAPPNWTAIVAILISIGTLLKTLWTDWRTTRHAKAADFETRYGAPVRTGLRDFERKLKTLRSFALPSPRNSDEMKAEVDTLRPGWEDAALEVGYLLGEVDGFNSLYEAGWRSAFEENCGRADAALESLVEEATTAEQAMKFAESALDDYRCAITAVRARLDRQSTANKSMFGKP